MSKFKIQEIQIGNTVTEYPFSLHEVVLRAVHAKTQLDNYKTPEAASVAVEAWNYLLQVRDVKQYPVLHAVAQAEYGLSLANFFNTNSKSIDIASAIQLLELTITHTSPFVQAAINGDKPRWFVALCVLYRRLFEQEGLQDLQKIDKAVEYARIAYKSSLPGSIYWSKGATNGATALHTRWRAKNSQSTEDLTEGIRMVEDVIKKSEPGTRQWAVQATILSDCLLYRFQAQGDQQDIIQAITLLEVAHTLVSPHESAIWGEIHCHLAVVLRLYAEVKCDLQILTRSIDVIHKGLQSINEVSPAWTELHQALADAFSTQAQITGSSESLDKALTIYQALTQQAHIGSLQWVVANFNYAGAAKQRYELLQRSEDLDLSISIYKEAEKHIKRDSYYWLQCQYSIGDVFHAYARLTKDGSVLAQSIQRFSSVSQALLHHPSTTLWAEAQWSLGRSYLTRFECNLPHDNESLSDIDSAIQAFSKVIEGSNSDNSITIKCIYERAYAFYLRFEKTRSATDKAQSKSEYESIRESKKYDKIDKVSSVLFFINLGTIYMIESQWQMAIDCLIHATTTIDGLYDQQVLLLDRHVWQAQGINAYRRAAFALAKVGRLEEAAIMLEKVRSRTLSEVLEIQEKDLQQLRLLDKSLAERYEQVRTKLEYFFRREQTHQFEPLNGHPETRPSVRQILREERRLAEEELKSVRDAIQRILPDFDNFSSTSTLKKIKSVVHSNTPLLYLDISNMGILALLIYHSTGGGSICFSSITLPEINIQELAKFFYKPASSSKKDSFIESIFVKRSTSFLQDGISNSLTQIFDILKPIIYTCSQEIRKLGVYSVIVSPGSLLSLCPIHFIEYSHDNRVMAFGEEFDVTYVPSASYYLSLVQREAINSPSFLALVDPDSCPANFTDWLAQETASLYGTGVILSKKEATTEQFLRQAQTPIYHLLIGCHGSFSVNNPLQSSLILHNGNFTLADALTRLNIHGTRLVTLCACAVGMREFRFLIDEAIGFPTALLLAGAQGVISPLWTISDIATVLILRKVYEYIQAGSTPSRAVVHAAHWLRRLDRAQFQTQIDTMLPHYKDQPNIIRYLKFWRDRTDSKPFQSPFYWAAFMYTGIIEAGETP